MIDVIQSVGQWQGFVSGHARLDIEAVGSTLALQYALDDTGGFVVAHGKLVADLAGCFSLSFQLSHDTAPLTMEVKLVSADGKDVWRAVHEATIPSDNRAILLEAHRFEYAWGETGAGRPGRIGAVEFAVVGRERRSGHLRISSPCLDVWMPKAPVHSTVFANDSTLCAESSVVLSGAGWSGSGPEHWLIVDHGHAGAFSGVALEFAGPLTGGDCVIQFEPEPGHWEVCLELSAVMTPATEIAFAPVHTRRFRLAWRSPESTPLITLFQGIPCEEARHRNEFAAREALRLPRGLRPGYLLGEQVWWTAVAAPDAATQALLNEHGSVEFGFASPTLEVGWRDADGLHTWASATRSVRLEDGLPLPVVTLEWPAMRVEVSAQPGDVPGSLMIRHRWTCLNEREAVCSAMVSPFQVSPPSQSHGKVGGVAPIASLRWRDDVLIVNDKYRWLMHPPVSRYSLATGLQQDPRLGPGPHQNEVSDDVTGAARALLEWSARWATGETRCIDLVVSELGHPARKVPAITGFSERRRVVASAWQEVLSPVSVTLPDALATHVEAWRLAVAHILGNRQGPMINPGPRRYARSWIRDAATMAEALLKQGLHREVQAFVEAFAPHVRDDGFVPCCVDLDGSADPLVEHDSHGQWINLVMNLVRYSGDMSLLDRYASSLFMAADFILQLRRSRLVEPWLSGPKAAAAGLLPESVSHEGYLAQPVHSYWDDVWGLRGLLDAAEAARRLGDAVRFERYNAEVDDFARSIRGSLLRVQSQHGIDYVPGSVEWADLDPSATACGPAQLELPDIYPGESMQRTMTLFMEHWRERTRSGMPLTKYSAYDIRVVRALVNMGRRDEAHELMDFLLADQRPRAWRQWPEISWPDPSSAGHVGDLPHSWISAEYVLAIRACFVEEQGDAMYLLRGVPARWFALGPLHLQRLPTRFGTVGFSVSLQAERLSFEWSLPVPKVDGGIWLDLPAWGEGRPARRVALDPGHDRCVIDLKL